MVLECWRLPHFPHATLYEGKLPFPNKSVSVPEQIGYFRLAGGQQWKSPNASCWNCPVHSVRHPADCRHVCDWPYCALTAAAKLKLNIAQSVNHCLFVCSVVLWLGTTKFSTITQQLLLSATVVWRSENSRCFCWWLGRPRPPGDLPLHSWFPAALEFA